MDLGRPWVTRALAIALVLAVGATVWLAARDGEDDPAPSPAPTAGGTRIVDERELTAIAAGAGHPVYWAGPIEGADLEVTEAAGAGGVLVRYLVNDAEAGETRAGSLAVGSYPLPDPRKALDRFAGQPGAIVRRSPQLGKVVTNERARGSVYFVDPGNEVQVEVYAPSPRRATRLVLSGQVQPAG